MNNSVCIKINDLYKSYKNATKRIDILKGINFEVNSGETIAIVGKSGIGKSTLLHIVGALDRPDKGTLLFFDKDVFSYNDEELAKFRNKSVGFVFQFHHLLPEFNAIENAMMPLLISKMNKKKASKQAEELLVRVGLQDRLTHRVGELSGGEQQRVAVARALVYKPSLFLADEPTGNLDRESSEQVHQLLMDLNKEFQMTMIVVTHNMELADLMTRKVTLYKGQVIDGDV